jgi:hydrogenase maturation protease
MTKMTPSTIVIGLGNPILGDDAVGWRVAETVEARLRLDKAERPEIECLAVGGLTLMEHLIGYKRAILVDAIFTGEQPIGQVLSFPLEALPNRAAGHLASAHDVTLQTALRIGSSMGAALPEEVTVVAIETPCVYDFSEELSPKAAEAVDVAVREVLNLLSGERP